MIFLYLHFVKGRDITFLFRGHAPIPPYPKGQCKLYRSYDCLILDRSYSTLCLGGHLPYLTFGKVRVKNANRQGFYIMQKRINIKF